MVAVVEQAARGAFEGPCAGEVDGVVVEHESIAGGPEFQRRLRQRGP